MRLFLAFCFLVISLRINSQDFILDNFPTKDSLIFYTDVIQVDSIIPASDLYLNAKNWMVDAFKSSKSVIQLDDKEAKVVVVKSYLVRSIPQVPECKFWFTLKIETKDSRYRYTLYDIQVEMDYATGTIPTIHYESGFEKWIHEAQYATSTKKWITKTQEEWKNYCGSLCKDVNDDLRNVLKSLETAMHIKTSNDW